MEKVKRGKVGRPSKNITDKEQFESECISAWSKYKERYDLKKKVKEAVWHKPFILPKKPEDPSSIINYGLPKKERKFPYYSDDYVNRMTAKNEHGEYRYPDFMRKEIERRLNGLFFYNGDKLEWITGHHYMTLQYWKIPVPAEGNRVKRGKPFFVDAQRDYWYAMRAMRADKRSFGLIYIGYRRSGKTANTMAEGYWDSTENEDSIFPIQSKTEKDAKKVFNKLIESWKLLPAPWKPNDDGSTTQSSKLAFKNAKKKVGIDNRTAQKELRSVIYPVTSNEVEVDGDYVSFFWRDECAKAPKNMDINESWEVTKPTLMIGNILVGKAIYTSTVEDGEKYGSLSTKRLWDRSDAGKRLPNGETKSGLNQFFIPCSYGYMGDEDEPDINFVDEWGYSDIEGATKYHKEILKHKEGDEILSYKRKFPLCIEDAWISKMSDNTFNLRKLMQHQKYAQETASQVLVRGNFEWENGIKDTKVIFRPDPDGRWQVGMMPNEEDRNKHEMRGAQRYPTRNYFYMGIDPFSHEKTVRYGSNGAGITMVGSYPWSSIKEGMVCVYNYRQDTPNLLAEDMIMQAVFYSSPILAERNTYGLIQAFEARGYKGFLLHNIFEKDPRKLAKQDLGVPNNSKDIRDSLVSMTASYIMDNIGFNENTQSYGFCPHEEMIEQWINFNILDWGKYDLVVAAALAIAAMRMPKVEVKSNYTTEDWFPQFKEKARQQRPWGRPRH